MMAMRVGTDWDDALVWGGVVSVTGFALLPSPAGCDVAQKGMTRTKSAGKQARLQQLYRILGNARIDSSATGLKRCLQ